MAARKKLVVLSLGGSLIAPKEVDSIFLNEFQAVLEKNRDKYKFIIVCGGGNPSRVYISALNKKSMKEKKKEHFQSLLGISITRLNARLLTYFFGCDANQGIPHNMKNVESLLQKKDFVFCGGLRYHKKETSDATAAKLASYFNCEFINITNVKGLCDKDPRKFKNAKLINQISSKEFYKIANRIRYKPGQHFVLDQKAAKKIKKHKIPTYIIGPDMDNFNNLLNNKHFVGTIIS